MKTYGETLKEFRAREGLTQRQMAARMGVKPSTYSAVETGRLKASETFKAAAARAQATGSPPRSRGPPPRPRASTSSSTRWRRPGRSSGSP